MTEKLRKDYTFPPFHVTDISLLFKIEESSTEVSQATEFIKEVSPLLPNPYHF